MTFQKGQSGNPKGRPARDKCLSDLLRKRLDDKVNFSISGPKKRVTVREAIVERLISQAKNGEKWAIIEVFDRVEGKATLAVEGSVDNFLHNIKPGIYFGPVDDEEGVDNEGDS